MKIPTQQIERAKAVPILSMVNDLKRVAQTGGGEYAGSCPLCGGKDRFHVSEEKWFFCRHCHPEKGDTINFLTWRDGLTFREAVEKLTDSLPKKCHETHKTPSKVVKRDLWRQKAHYFANACQDALWSPTGKHALDYLLKRGFTEWMIEEAGLGYNPTPRVGKREAWGLQPEKNKDGKWRQMYAWGDALTIPWQIHEQNQFGINKVRFRLLNPTVKGNRYRQLAGGANSFYSFIDPTDEIIFLAEGELDALSINQIAQQKEGFNFVSGVATGGTTSGRTIQVIAKLATARKLILAFDDDKAGNEAADYWQTVFPKAKRWRPIGGDVNDMLRDGTLADWMAEVVAPHFLKTPFEPDRQEKEYSQGYQLSAHEQIYEKLVALVGKIYDQEKERLSPTGQELFFNQISQVTDKAEEMILTHAPLHDLHDYYEAQRQTLTTQYSKQEALWQSTTGSILPTG